MNSILTFPTLLASALLSTSFAQSIETPQALLTSENDKRTSKNIADAAAKTQANIEDTAKSEMFKRAQQLQKNHAAYLKNLSDGKIRPFSNIVEKWDTYKSQTTNISTSYADFLNAKTPEEKSKLAVPLLIALQPVGPYLQNARHGARKQRYLTQQQVDQQELLMERFNTLPSSDDDNGKLTLITPQTYYTLKNLPITIQFSAPPNTEVMLFSELGGKFSNQLDYISIIADKNGLATTSWVSIGGGVSDCSILFRSPQYSSKGHITPVVKRPELIPLDRISPIVKTTVEKIPASKPSLPAKLNQ